MTEQMWMQTEDAAEGIKLEDGSLVWGGKFMLFSPVYMLGRHTVGLGWG